MWEPWESWNKQVILVTWVIQSCTIHKLLVSCNVQDRCDSIPGTTWGGGTGVSPGAGGQVVNYYLGLVDRYLTITWGWETGG